MIDGLLILDVFSHRLFSMDRQGPSVCGRLCRNLEGRINIDHILLFRRPGLWTQYERMNTRRGLFVVSAST